MMHTGASTRAGATAAMTAAVALAVASPSIATMVDPFCALQARRTVDVGNGSSIDGDVAATEPGGRVHLGRQAFLADDALVVGHEVRLGPGASADDVATNDLFLSRGASVRGGREAPMLPVLEPACVVAPIECGGDSVSVKKGQGHVALPPGSYGAVTVRNGATLALQPGTYHVCELDVGRGGTVVLPMAGQVELRIAGDVRFGVGSALIGPAGGLLPIIDVTGASVRLASRADVHAVLSAPDAQLVAGPHVGLTGRFCADRIHLSRRSRVACPETGGTTTSTTTSSSTSSTSSSTSTSSTVLSTSSTSSSSTTSTAVTSSTATTMAPTTTSTSTTTSTFPAGECGDGVPQGAEECDDGNVDPTDGCSNGCTACGNEVVTAPEECDDGNLIDGDGCDSHCRVTGCGNGLVVAPETCDDGNTEDGDNCPSNCIIEQCQPLVGSDRTVAVDFDSGGGSNVAGLTIFVDYPEGKVSIPGSGGSVPAGIITDLPGFSLGQTNDLDYAVRQVITDSFAFPDGLAFDIHFEDCEGAAPLDPAGFTCLVEGASDASGAAVDGVTCSVRVPGASTTTTLASTTTTIATTTSTSSSTTSSSTSSSSTSSSSSTTSSVPQTTTTTSSSTSTTILGTCGNGTVEAPEDCDDGQTMVPALQGDPSDNDTCPGDCAIEDCTLEAATVFTARVAFDAASPVGGGTLLVVYPEGKVGFPVSGPVPPTYFVPQLPSSEVLVRGFDLDHALRVAIADGDPSEPVPVGPVAELRFQTCASQPNPLPGEFQCYVIEMSDPVGNQIQTGVRCSVQFD